MSYNNDPMGAALDRHITGNWGEDSVDEWCEERECECRDEDGVPNEDCEYGGDTSECRASALADEIDRTYDEMRDRAMEDGE